MSETKPSISASAKKIISRKSSIGEYRKLLNLNDTPGYIKNSDPFECSICLTKYETDAGIVLRECLHTFCVECICDLVKNSSTVEIQCPFVNDHLVNCDYQILQRDIMGIMPNDEFDKFLAKCLQFAEKTIENTIHCKTIDCNGFYLVELGDSSFLCEVCNIINCIKCNVRGYF